MTPSSSKTLSKIVKVKENITEITFYASLAVGWFVKTWCNLFDFTIIMCRKHFIQSWFKFRYFINVWILQTYKWIKNKIKSSHWILSFEGSRMNLIFSLPVFYFLKRVCFDIKLQFYFSQSHLISFNTPLLWLWKQLRPYWLSQSRIVYSCLGKPVKDHSAWFITITSLRGNIS